jgi:hypothetical protein
MAQLLLVHDDPVMLADFGMILRRAGYELVVSPETPLHGALESADVDDLVQPHLLSSLQIADILLGILRHHQSRLPIVLVVSGIASVESVTEAFSAEDTAIDDHLDPPHPQSDPGASPGDQVEAREAHAAARWARILVRIVDAPRDPRTIGMWSRYVYMSPGAVRNWCRIAGVSPRRSLVFARLLRAVVLGQGGRQRPENLLDVVDRRTLIGLFRFAGLNPHGDFPKDVDSYLERQSLVRDSDCLCEISRALKAREVVLHKAS